MAMTSGHVHRDTVSMAEEQVRHWLKTQHYEGPVAEEGRHRVGAQAVLDCSLKERVRGAKGAKESLARWRLREFTLQGIWQTSLTVSTPTGGRTWVRLDAELLPARGVAMAKAPVPTLARGLLDVLSGTEGEHQGSAALHAMPTVIERGDLDEVLDELCDPDRRLPIVVASTPAHTDFDDWLAETVDPLLRGCAGLAVLYALAPGAEREFNRTLEHHRVFGGAVRTYLPGLDPAWQPDAQRHRVMARHTFETDLRRASGLLAWLPRRLAVQTPLPDALAALPPLRARGLTDSGAEIDGVQPGSLLVDTHEEEALEERARAGEIQEVRRWLRAAEERESELAAEYDEQYSELREARTEVRSLRGRLAAVGYPDLPHAPQPDRDSLTDPASFAELLERMGEFPLLRFTGDARLTRDLDQQTDHPTWVRMAWDALLALQDYAEAAVQGESNGDFRRWCENTPAACHPFPPRKVIRDESRTVRSHGKWKTERELPVPVAVNPTGEVFMGAHLRIGGGGTAPRLHYHDDCSGTGRIYIGYMGLHLHNTRTN
ncbi:hypothetical protein [Streptacidiphilus sp. P02-A3a]|uniref:hypothetical protein n=1 Tax=Streptacidiphilus sp. P02-A3a TaxID=2704468 RepID=UPI0015FBF862|nr:hypothetical protein [Streptacidiphilus sp. P02-A3a]QMU73175.1 hypothetical protein GXP74_38045 [Streptacidiphilus sp. P02-A3a]